MKIELPGNVSWVKDEGVKGELNLGDVLAFPGTGDDEEVHVTYNEVTAPMLYEMVHAEDEYCSYRLMDESGLKIAEAFASYVQDAPRLTFQSVRFTGDIKPYIQLVTKATLVARK